MVVRSWAGEYDRRVTVWRDVSTRAANTDGQRPESSQEFCQRWASVKPARATERYMSQQNKHDVTHVVKMRRDSETVNINGSFWLTLADGTRLDIRGIYDGDGRRMELILECNQRTT